MKFKHVIILFFGILTNSFGQNIPEKPNPERLVNDFANILNEDEELTLENKLKNYYDTTSNQFAIVTINSLEGYDIESYSYKLASTWGIGTKEKNNGILILVAYQDHKMRIEVGYGLEGAVPDAATKLIIRDVMRPYFKQGNYYTGLDQATSHLIKYASGEYKADPKSGQKGLGRSAIFILVILIIIIFSIISKVNKVRGSHLGNNLTLWTILSLLSSGNNNRHGGGGGWGGGSGGGGGFGGFGGGGFGGGGSSGSW